MMRVVPCLVDLLLVLLFAVIGRASHGMNLLGILSTAWPFLLSCLVAWIVVAAVGDMGYGVRAAGIVWVMTWVGGIAVRLVSGDTADPAFIVVAALFLALVLWGWRLIAFGVRSWRLRRRAAQ